MKSKINTLADYREASFEKNVRIECGEDYIQRQLKHLTRKYKKTEAVTGLLEKGDVTVMALESEIAKFNKPAVFVTLGGGLFDRDFEEKIIGHSVGDSFEAEAEGKPVKVTVKQAARTFFPEATDAMAESYAKDHDGFEGVKTVAEYREKVIEKYFEEQKQKVFFDAMDQVIEYVLTHSDFDFDEEEISEYIKESKREIEETLKEEGKSLENMSAEELQADFGVRDAKELEQVIRISAENYIAQELWLAKIHGVESADDIEGYPFGFLNDFVEENLKTEEVR